MDLKIGNFYVELQVDGTIAVKQATKTMEEMGATSEKAIKKINDGVETASKTVFSFGKVSVGVFTEIAKTLALGATAASGLAYGFTKIAKSVTEDVFSLEKFNNETGLSVDLLQQWQQAIKKTDLSANVDQVTSSVASLQEKLQTALEPRQIEAFMHLQINPFKEQAVESMEDKIVTNTRTNLFKEKVVKSTESMEDKIVTNTRTNLFKEKVVKSTQLETSMSLQANSVKKDAFEILDEIRDKIKTFSNAETLNLLKNLGLGAEFLPVLRMTKTEFDSLANSKLLSTKQRNDIVSLGRGFEALKMQIGSIKEQFVAEASPRFLSMLKDVGDWVEENKGRLFAIGKGLGDVFGGLIDVFVRLGKAVSLAFDPLRKAWDALPEPLKALIALGATWLLPGGKVVAALAVGEDIVEGKNTLKKNERLKTYEDKSVLGVAAAFANFGDLVNDDAGGGGSMFMPNFSDDKKERSIFQPIGDIFKKSFNVMFSPKEDKAQKTESETKVSNESSTKNVTVNQTFNISGQNSTEVANEVAKKTKSAMNNTDMESANVLRNNGT